jgi:protein SCO1/2
LGEADSVPAQIEEIAFEQKLGNQVPLDLAFRDDRNRGVRLQKYFGEKPVILVLAYNRCPRLCSVVLQALVTSLRQVPLEPGTDFHVVVVSIDHREGPALSRPKKEALLAEYGRPETAEGWHILTGKQPAIQSLADAVGFRFVYDASADVFRHASGVMVLTPDGKVARYFFGIDYPPSYLRLGLTEASEGKIGSPVDKALLLTCLAYDAESGKYLVSPMKLMRLAAILTVLGLGVYLLRQWTRKAPAPEEDSDPVILPEGPAHVR